MNMLAHKSFSVFEEENGNDLPVKPFRMLGSMEDMSSLKLSGQNISAKINQLLAERSAVSLSSSPQKDSTLGTAIARAVNADATFARVLSIPQKREPLFFINTFAPSQEWEGYVREIKQDAIEADLVDITAGATRITDQAEIPLKELSETELAKVKLGAVFRWSIGYQRTASGTKMRVSNIVFRDLPRWTLRDRREARTEANEFQDFFRQPK